MIFHRFILRCFAIVVGFQWSSRLRLLRSWILKNLRNFHHEFSLISNVFFDLIWYATTARVWRGLKCLRSSHLANPYEKYLVKIFGIRRWKSITSTRTQKDEFHRFWGGENVYDRGVGFVTKWYRCQLYNQTRLVYEECLYSSSKISEVKLYNFLKYIWKY